jgi:competence protein ComEA
VDDRGWRTLAWGVAAVVAVLLGTRLLGSAPDPPPVRVDAAGGDRSRPEVQRIYIHVAGAVRRPGLYRLRRGTRVADAVERAGGPLAGADLTATNLAAPLQDGQQVVVAKALAGGEMLGEDAPISLGSATVEQLDALDGIGPTLAERIVEHRRQSGGFASIDQLAEVEGIGEKRLEALERSLSP